MISIEEADALAVRCLGELRTHLGGRQVDHARRVAAGVAGEADRVVAAALLHDVLEKSELSADDLLVATGDANLVSLVQTLSRRDDESDREYLRRCADDRLAYRVKRVDLADKLTAEDVQVDPKVADALRQQARERLVLLDALAQSLHRGGARD